MNEPITCNLAENALDYLILAGEQAKEGSPRMTKHALATLADGIELLLKARLELRDWCLIFKDVDQASRSKYESGDFQSVTFDQAIVRLKNLCSVEISPKHRPVIDELRQLRNRVRHFAVTVDRQEAVSLIAKTFSFAIEFATQHLEQKAIGVGDEMSRLRLLLGEFEEFVQERYRQIQPQRAEKMRLLRSGLECPKCLQLEFYGDNRIARCLFCGFECAGESIADEWAEQFRPNDGAVVSCPKCGIRACVEEPDADCDAFYTCLSCGQCGFEVCPACDNLHDDDKDEGLCKDCWEKYYSRKHPT